MYFIFFLYIKGNEMISVLAWLLTTFRPRASPSPLLDQVQQLVEADQYDPSRPQGHGAKADVYRIILDHRTYALKIQKPSPTFDQELAITQRVAETTPHVPRCFGGFVTRDGTRAVLVLEWLEGYTELGYVSDASLATLFDSPSDPSKAQRFWACVTSGLNAIHGLGLAHGDLSKSNVMLNTATGEAKLLDFGNVARDDETPDERQKHDLLRLQDLMGGIVEACLRYWKQEAHTAEAESQKMEDLERSVPGPELSAFYRTRQHEIMKKWRGQLPVPGGVVLSGMKHVSVWTHPRGIQTVWFLGEEHRADPGGCKSSKPVKSLPELLDEVVKRGEARGQFFDIFLETTKEEETGLEASPLSDLSQAWGRCLREKKGCVGPNMLLHWVDVRLWETRPGTQLLWAMEDPKTTVPAAIERYLTKLRQVYGVGDPRYEADTEEYRWFLRTTFLPSARPEVRKEWSEIHPVFQDFKAGVTSLDDRAIAQMEMYLEPAHQTQVSSVLEVLTDLKTNGSYSDEKRRAYVLAMKEPILEVEDRFLEVGMFTMDMYAVSRIFHDFKSRYAKNVIVVSGGRHSETYADLFENVFHYQRQFVATVPPAPALPCLDLPLSKLESLFLSAQK